MKFKGVLVVALMFVIIFPTAIFASFTENKSSMEKESFDGSITNNSLAISPDEQIAIVSDSREQSIRIYDLAKGTLRKKIDGFVTPRNIVFVNNGSEFVVSTVR